MPDVAYGKTGELITDENVDELNLTKCTFADNWFTHLTKDFRILYAFNATFLGMTSTMADEDIAFSLLSSVMSSYLEEYILKSISPRSKG